MQTYLILPVDVIFKKKSVIGNMQRHPSSRMQGCHAILRKCGHIKSLAQLFTFMITQLLYNEEPNIPSSVALFLVTVFSETMFFCSKPCHVFNTPVSQ